MDDRSESALENDLEKQSQIYYESVPEINIISGTTELTIVENAESPTIKEPPVSQNRDKMTDVDGECDKTEIAFKKDTLPENVSVTNNDGKSETTADTSMVVFYVVKGENIDIEYDDLPIETEIICNSTEMSTSCDVNKTGTVLTIKNEANVGDPSRDENISDIDEYYPNNKSTITEEQLLSHQRNISRNNGTIEDTKETSFEGSNFPGNLSLAITENSKSQSTPESYMATSAFTDGENFANADADVLDKIEAIIVHADRDISKIEKFKYNSLSYLRNHHKDLKCKECKRSFTNSFCLRKHIEAVHLKLKNFTCNECERAFSRREQLKRHINVIHLNIRKFMCEMCKTFYSTQGNLKNHLEAIHFKTKNYTCSECDRSYSRKDSLKWHIQSVHTAYQFKCHFCLREFAASQPLKLHIQSVHLKIKNFTCDECKRPFSLKADLKKHYLSVHMKIRLRKFKCTLCTSKFTSKIDLRGHVKTVHYKIKMFTCDICQRVLSSNGILKRHVELFHLDE